MRRRCGWKAAARGTPERVVWARKRAASVECPKSFITAQSIAWVEEFLVRRRLGGLEPDGMGAREVEAFLILEQEMAGERGDE